MKQVISECCIHNTWPLNTDQNYKVSPPLLGIQKYLVSSGEQINSIG